MANIDVLITPGSGEIKWVDSSGSSFDVKLVGSVTNELYFLGANLATGGFPVTGTLAWVQDLDATGNSTSSVFLPGISGYALGSSTYRWAVYGTNADISGNVTIGGTLGVTGTLTGITATPRLDTLTYGNALATAQIASVDFVNNALLMVRAGHNMTASGTYGVDTSFNISWASRFTVTSQGTGSNWSTSGSFDLSQPAATQTVTSVGGAATGRTFTASGFALGVWEALYYALPLGGTNTSQPGNFYVAYFTSTYTLPAHWVLIAVRNGDSATIRFGTGVTLSAGQTHGATGEITYVSTAQSGNVAFFGTTTGNLNNDSGLYYDNTNKALSIGSAASVPSQIGFGGTATPKLVATTAGFTNLALISTSSTSSTQGAAIQFGDASGTSWGEFGYFKNGTGNALQATNRLSGPVQILAASGSVNINANTASQSVTFQTNSATRLSISDTGITSSVTHTFAGGANIQSFSGGSWIDMPTGGPSGLGSGGAGSNVWIGYVQTNGNWFTNSAAGDVAYRNAAGRLLFGSSSGTWTMSVGPSTTGGVIISSPASGTTALVLNMPGTPTVDTLTINTVSGSVGVNSIGSLYTNFTNSGSVTLAQIQAISTLSSTTGGAIRGVYGQVNVGGAAGISAGQTLGLYGHIRSTSGSGIVSAASALQGTLEITAGSVNWTTAAVNSASLIVTGGSGNITNLTMFKGVNQNQIDSTHFTGTITNFYGLYLDPVTGATNNYAIFTNTGKIQFGGGIANNAYQVVSQLLTPTTPTITAGTAGTGNTYYYRVSAVAGTGQTLACAETSVQSGAVIGVGNAMTSTWTAVTGAESYNVYGRTTGAELLVANVQNTTFADTGAATPAGALPTINTTGYLTASYLSIPTSDWTATYAMKSGTNAVMGSDLYGGASGVFTLQYPSAGGATIGGGTSTYSDGAGLQMYGGTNASLAGNMVFDYGSKLAPITSTITFRFTSQYAGTTTVATFDATGNLMLTPQLGGGHGYGLRLANVPFTSLPAAAAGNSGGIVYDATSNILRYSNGSAWSTIGGGGAVSSVANSDSTLTISPTTGAVVASLNLAHANTWTASQTFSSAKTNFAVPTASYASVNFAGSAAISPSSPAQGDLWHDGTATSPHLYFVDGGGFQRDLLQGGSINLSRAIPTSTTTLNCVEIGNFTAGNGAHSVLVTLYVNASGYSQTKTWIISSLSANSPAWTIPAPLSDTGAYSGNDLELNAIQTNTVLYLRLRRISGSVAGTATVRIVDLGGPSAFAATSATATDISVLGVWPTKSPVSQIVVGASSISGPITVTGSGSITPSISGNTLNIAGVPSVTNIATTAGVTGGPITSTGTLSLDTSYSPTWTNRHSFVFAPTASASVAAIQIGNGGFTGVSPSFNGNPNGTYLGLNAAAGYTGDIFNFEISQGIARGGILSLSYQGIMSWNNPSLAAPIGSTAISGTDMYGNALTVSTGPSSNQGYKLVIYPKNIGGPVSNRDYAIGVETGALWFASDQSYKFYTANSSGSGQFPIGSFDSSDSSIRVFNRSTITYSTGFKSSLSSTATTVYTLPAAYPSIAGYALVSDTAGVLSWTAVSSGAVNTSGGSSPQSSTAATTLAFSTAFTLSTATGTASIGLGTVGVAGGGTGLTSFTAVNQVLVSGGTGSITSVAAPSTGGTYLGYTSGVLGWSTPPTGGAATSVGVGSTTATSGVVGQALVVSTGPVVGQTTGGSAGQYLQYVSTSAIPIWANAVGSVTAANTSITIGGTALAPTVGLNLGNANTWSAAQVFSANPAITTATVPSLTIGPGAGTTRVRLLMALGDWLGLSVNANYVASAYVQDDTSKSSWIVDYGSGAGDAFGVFRAPATVGTPAFSSLLGVSSAGLVTASSLSLGNTLALASGYSINLTDSAANVTKLASNYFSNINGGLDISYPSLGGIRFGAGATISDGAAFQGFGGTNGSFPGQMYFDYGSSARSLAGAAATWRYANGAAAQAVFKLDNLGNGIFTPLSGGAGLILGNVTSASVTTAANGMLVYDSGSLKYYSGSWQTVAAGSNAVNSVSNADSTLTISPTFGVVVASLNLGHANTWTANQTINAKLVVGGAGSALSAATLYGAASTGNFAGTTMSSTGSSIGSRVFIAQSTSILHEFSVGSNISYDATNWNLDDISGYGAFWDFLPRFDAGTPAVSLVTAATGANPVTSRLRYPFQLNLTNNRFRFGSAAFGVASIGGVVEVTSNSNYGAGAVALNVLGYTGQTGALQTWQNTPVSTATTVATMDVNGNLSAASFSVGANPVVQSILPAGGSAVYANASGQFNIAAGTGISVAATTNGVTITSTGGAASSIGVGSTAISGSPTPGSLLFVGPSSTFYLGQTAVGTSGQFLQSAGAGTPTWAAAVTSVSATNSTLTAAGGVSTPTLALNLGNANTWTAQQNFNATVTVGTGVTAAFGTGLAAPSSVGTGHGYKLQLYPGGTLGTPSVGDYALGTETSALWLNTGGGVIKFYNAGLASPMLMITAQSTVATGGYLTLGAMSAVPGVITGGQIYYNGTDLFAYKTGSVAVNLTSPASSGVTSIAGTAPITASASTGAVTLSLAGAGTAGTYAFPSSLTTDTFGRVTAVTAGPAPLTGGATSGYMAYYNGANTLTGSSSFQISGTTMTLAAGTVMVNNGNEYGTFTSVATAPEGAGHGHGSDNTDIYQPSGTPTTDFYGLVQRSSFAGTTATAFSVSGVTSISNQAGTSTGTVAKMDGFLATYQATGSSTVSQATGIRINTASTLTAPTTAYNGIRLDKTYSTGSAPTSAAGIYIDAIGGIGTNGAAVFIVSDGTAKTGLTWVTSNSSYIGESPAANLYRSAASTLKTDGSLSIGVSLTLGTALSVASGGTGQITFTANNILVGNGASTLSSLTPSTGYLNWTGSAYAWSSVVNSVTATTNGGITVSGSVSATTIGINLAANFISGGTGGGVFTGQHALAPTLAATAAGGYALQVASTPGIIASAAIVEIGSGGWGGAAGNFSGNATASTGGTQLGINAASGFTGSLIDAQANGVSQFSVTGAGTVTIPAAGLYKTGANLVVHSILPNGGSAVYANASGQFNIAQGSGITVASSANGVTISATSSSAFTWAAITASQTAVVTNGYITNSASLITLTLPPTAVIGSIIELGGQGAGGWSIAQAASQLVQFGSFATTAGTGGSLASTNQYDCVRLICITTNTTWLVLSSVGNLNVT